MAVVAIIYGLNYFVLKPVFEAGIDSFAVLAIRCTITAAFFWIYHALFVRERIRERRDFLRLLLAAFFGISINQLFFLWGLSLTSRVNAAVLMILTPVFVFLAAWLLREERFSLRTIVGLLISFGGACGLILSGSDQQFQVGGATVTGDLMIMVNAASYGLYLVFVRPLVLKYHTFTIIKWLFLLGSLPNILMGIGPLSEASEAIFTTEIMLRIGFLIAFATIGAYWLNAWAMKRLPSSAVGIYIYVQPVFVALLSAGLGMGELSWLSVPFIFLIFAGVWLVSMRKPDLQQRQSKEM
ncbi:MAG TPA: DMT family transporter [Bacteroidia bacterium]|nr:DMT family transporter [Bacteroidia bacterium]